MKEPEARTTLKVKIRRNRIKNTQGFSVDFLLQSAPSLAPIALRKEVTSEALGLETQKVTSESFAAGNRGFKSAGSD